MQQKTETKGRLSLNGSVRRKTLKGERVVEQKTVMGCGSNDEVAPGGGREALRVPEQAQPRGSQ